VLGRLGLNSSHDFVRRIPKCAGMHIRVAKEQQVPKIFVSRRIPDKGLNVLWDAFGREAVTIYPEDRVIPREELLKGVRGVDALLCILTDAINDEVLEAAGPQLRIVANFAVGYNNIDVPACTKRGVPVTNTPGVLTETTADLTFAILMGIARRLGEGERIVRTKSWTGWGPMQLLGTDVYGKTLGVFGMGRIGQAVARRATGFNLRVIYTSRSPLEPGLEKSLNATRVDKAALLEQSDFLSIHCPFTPETRHSFGEAEFKAMKKTAYVINTSRGPVVDEKALAAALKSGEIAGAALDVFEEEPKIHDALFARENVLLIPHLGSATLETRGMMGFIAATNVVELLSGRRPPNCVNPEVLG
jgi:glyoxylate reductase